MTENHVGQLMSASFEPADCRKGWKPARRWGFGERADAEEAHRRLLDGAKFCYERLGIVSTSMADIAAQAKVTRPTVYRYFKTRNDVVGAVLKRELELLWRQLEKKLMHLECFGDFLVELLKEFLFEASRRDQFALLFSTQALRYLPEILLAHSSKPGSHPHPIYSFALRPGARIPADMEVAIEWFCRLAVSYLYQPAIFEQDEVEFRQLLAGLSPWPTSYIKRAKK